MTTRKYLKQIQLLQIRIAQWKREAERLRSEAFSLGSPGFDADPVQVSKTGSVLERKVTEYLDMMAKIDKRIIQLSKMRDRLIHQIQQMDNPQYMQVLYLRYVECRRIRDIAQEMNFSDDWIRHLLDKAEKAFATVTGKNTTQKDTKRHKKTHFSYAIL